MERKTEGIAQQFRGRLKSLWGDITDDDVKRSEGNLDRLVGIIKEKTGEAEEDIRAKLNDLTRDDDRERKAS
jgi:uncharacterized protein YjbJ (UPF0337 family)